MNGCCPSHQSGAYPLVYQIHGRSWIRALSERAGQNLTLGDVPEEEFERWARLGLSCVWLMGIWETGPRSRAQCLSALAAAGKGFTAGDIDGSPYAIAGYKPAKVFGGIQELQIFRQRLHSHGLKLMLDFIPNHVGLDHPWLTQHPDWFVHATRRRPGTFSQDTIQGRLFVAHGRDPFFQPWADTAQLDCRNRTAREAVRSELSIVAGWCDAVRCDMAMLVLNEVFAKTWKNFPAAAAGASEGDFWAEAIPGVKSRYPEFVFVAEVYWGLERRLQNLGFDYTYDKIFYDRLLARRPAEVQAWFCQRDRDEIARGMRFLENHDEPRIASLLTPDEHRAAALLLLSLPGMRLLHEGQLDGAAERAVLHLGRTKPAPTDPQIRDWYVRVLEMVRSAGIGLGQWQVIRPSPAWEGNPTAGNFMVIQWQNAGDVFSLVVVNLAGCRSQCLVRLTGDRLVGHAWQMSDLLGTESYQRDGGELAGRGLFLDVPPYAAHLYEFRQL